jgi:DNA-binding NarL/FixJ family response regulator
MLGTQQYGLLILDIDMPGTQYKKMISELKGIQKDIKILVFSGYDKDVAIQYIREGAEGYLNKQSSEEEIKNAVRTVIEKGYFYPAELIGLIIQNKRIIRQKNYQPGNMRFSNFWQMETATLRSPINSTSRCLP